MKRCLIALFALISVSAQAETPRVMASIKPLHSLVAAVMEGVGEPVLIVPGKTSEHTFQLKPSQVEQLQKAQIIFYIGREYETFLMKPLAQLPDSTRVVPMERISGVTLYPRRDGADFEAEEHEATDDKRPHLPGNDLHLWLDPANARAMTDAIEAALSQRYPADAPRFKANAQKLKERLRVLDQELARTYAPVKGKPFIVFHDAYHYLEKAYGLRAAGSITVNPESPPGARHISELRDKIRRLQVVCVFREPQYDDRIVAMIIKDTKAKEATLDHIGAVLPQGPELYFTMMRALAGDLAGCLK